MNTDATENRPRTALGAALDAERLRSERDAERAHASMICDLCVDADESAAMAGFIKSKASLATVRAELARRQAIRASVADARTRNSAIDPLLADEMIGAGLTAEQARVRLGGLPAPVAAAAPSVTPSADASDPFGWGGAFAKVRAPEMAHVGADGPTDRMDQLDAQSAPADIGASWAHAFARARACEHGDPGRREGPRVVRLPGLR